MAAASPSPQAPKFPNPREVAGCVDYLVSYWKILGGESPAAIETRKRLLEAKQQKTPQLAIARAIYLGPSSAMAGADRWLKVAIALQNYVKDKAGENPVKSVLGGALADVAGAVSHAASTASAGAKGAAAEAMTAVATQGAKLASMTIPTPGDMMPGIMEIPATLARKTLDRITSLFPSVGEKLKEMVGGTAIGLGVIAVLAVGAYALFMFVTLKVGFKILPKLIKML